MTTVAPVRLPSSKAVRDLLADLLGREVEVRPGTPAVPSAVTPCSVGVYVGERTRTAAVAVLDLRLAARAGAALGLLPRSAAEEAVAAARLSDAEADNVHEVLNIMSALFNVDGGARLTLWSSHRPGESPPPDVTVLTRAIGRRLDLAVSMQGYGDGALSVVLAL